MSFETGGLKINQQSQTFFQWSTTDEGRRQIGQKVILIGGTVITTASWCWHMFLIDWMKDAYSTYENKHGGMESLAAENKKVGALTESFQRLFTSVQSRAGLKDHTMDNIDIFYSKSLDPVSAGIRHPCPLISKKKNVFVAGLARSSQGAVVGIPEHMLQVTGTYPTLKFESKSYTVVPVNIMKRLQYRYNTLVYVTLITVINCTVGAG